MKFGVQLYTLHDYMKTLEDFDNTLKRVSEIGFHYIQVSGACKFEPQWLKERLEKYDLECILTHVEPDDLKADPAQVAKDHDVFGCKYVGLGGMPRLWSHKEFTNDEVIDKFLEEFTPVVEGLYANGKYFMYHNHHFEFAKLKNGKTIWETILNTFPTEKLGVTLDTYWIQYSGLNPVKVIKSLKGRIPCVHFKDYSICRDEEHPVRFAPVGRGNLDWDNIIPACEEAGTEYIFIEQDICFGEDPFKCLEESFNFLKSKGISEK